MRASHRSSKSYSAAGPEVEHLLLFSVFQSIPIFYFSVLNYEYALVFIQARKILQVKEKNKKKGGKYETEKIHGTILV